MKIDGSSASCPGCGADTRDVELLPDPAPAPEIKEPEAGASPAPFPWVRVRARDDLPKDDNVKLIYTEEGAYDIAGCVDPETNTWSCSPMIGRVALWGELPEPLEILSDDEAEQGDDWSGSGDDSESKETQADPAA